MSTIKGVFSLSFFSLLHLLFSQKGLSYGSELLHGVLTPPPIRLWGDFYNHNFVNYQTYHLVSDAWLVVFNIQLVFLGARAPLEIASVSKSVSQSVTKKFENNKK